MKVSYDLDQIVKAKTEKLTLVTLEIKGGYAKRSGVTYQGFLFTDDDVNRAWEFFEWLSTRKPGKKRKSKNRP